ncbi:uncharacterized protein [Oscarella lobularis]|uniref:uncharacterized protein isoform X2 n=1 Tax=Oscarella lobularis TaxID=121494 RepID=UPI003313B6FD
MQETAFAICNSKARCDQDLTLKYDKTAQKYEEVTSPIQHILLWDSVACVISQCYVLYGSIPSSKISLRQGLFSPRHLDQFDDINPREEEEITIMGNLSNG